MKAIVYTKYGSPDVLQLRDVEKPVAGDDEVLVKIHAASINYGDWGFVRGKPLLVRVWSGFLNPKFKMPGGDIAGRVEAVGRNVKRYQPGDEVFGDVSGCGWGGFAEYARAREDVLALKLANISFEQAAAVPIAGITALQGIRWAGEICPGQKVLINGASGGVGIFALQLAKAFGAEVTAVCSTRNQDMARALGADRVIDYSREDFTKSGLTYDLIIAANGYHPIADYKRALSPRGIYVCTGGSLSQVFQSMVLGPLMSKSGGKKMGNMGVTKPNRNDLTLMADLLEAGKIKSVIDRSYPLSEISEAFRYFEKEGARGKVIITVPHDGNH